MRGLVGGLDVDLVPLPEAPDLWYAFDRVERLAAGAKVLLARRVDESKVWQTAGYNTAAVWMSRHAATTSNPTRLGPRRRHREGDCSHPRGVKWRSQNGRTLRSVTLTYEVRVRGRLSPTLIAQFAPLLPRAEVGSVETVLQGPVADQAALYGLLRQIEALGLELLELRRVTN